MEERQKRLKEVYEYLRKYYDIHTPADFAFALHKSRNSIYLAMSGNEKYLTNKLFKIICDTFPNTFNLDYLLTGEGSLLAEKEPAGRLQSQSEVQYTTIDQSSLVNALLASKDETIASLRQQLRQSDEYIAALRSNIADLQRQLSADRTSETLTSYPYANDSKIITKKT